jgi:hypothetical protein
MDLNLIISKRSRILSLSFGVTGFGLAFLPSFLQFYPEFNLWQERLNGGGSSGNPHWQVSWPTPLWYTGLWGISLLFQSSFIVSILAMVWRKRKGSNFPTLGFSIPDAFKVDVDKGMEPVVFCFDKTGAALSNRELESSNRRSLEFYQEGSGRVYVAILLSCIATSLFIIVNIGANFPAIHYDDLRYYECFASTTIIAVPLVAAKLAMCALTFLLALLYVLLSLRGPKLRSIFLYTRFFWLENRMFAFLTTIFLIGTIIYSFIGDPIRMDKLPPFEVLLLPIFDLFLVISPRDSRVARWLFRLLFFCFMLDAELRYLVRGIDNNSCEKLDLELKNRSRAFTAASLLHSLLFALYGTCLSRWHAICGRKCRNPQDPGSAWQRTTAEENIIDIHPEGPKV